MLEKDKLAVCLDHLIDDIDGLSQQITEIASPTGNPAAIQYGSDTATFLASLFTASKYTTDQIETRIKTIKESVRAIKLLLTKESYIEPKDHKLRVSTINGCTSFVRVSNKVSLDLIADLDNSSEATSHYKKIETVMLGFRSLLLEFNTCIIEYNRLHPSQPLSSMVETDISPLG